jgi:protein-tyrosine phosphatase
MHAPRRKRLERRIRSGPVPDTVLVLCHGNICRSPFVALQLAAATGAPRVVSAGFLRSGRPSPPEAVAAAKAHGIRLEQHRSLQVDAALLGRADLIVVMEPIHVSRVAQLDAAAAGRTILLGELDPSSFQTRRVPDPWGHEPRVFAHCYARLERCTRAFAGILEDVRAERDGSGHRRPAAADSSTAV